jgi:hypothetical protein
LRPLSELEYAWQKCGELQFWLAKSASMDELTERCEPLWTILLGADRRAAVDPLMWIEREAAQERHLARESGGAGIRSIVSAFPGQARKLFSAVVSEIDILPSVFDVGTGDYGKRERALFVIETLGRIGTEESIALIDSLADSPFLGEAVVSAIRSIRSRRDTLG